MGDTITPQGIIDSAVADELEYERELKTVAKDLYARVIHGPHHTERTNLSADHPGNDSSKWRRITRGVRSFARGLFFAAEEEGTKAPTANPVPSLWRGHPAMVLSGVGIVTYISAILSHLFIVSKRDWAIAVGIFGMVKFFFLR